MTSKINATAGILTSLFLCLTVVHKSAGAELPVNLRSAGDFGALAGSTVTSIGATAVNGDLGVWPGSSVTGFPPGIVNGDMHINDPVAQTAQGDLTTAYNDAAGRSTAPVSIAGDLGGLTLAPGLYKSTSSINITGNLTLDAQGDPNAVWIFQIATTLTTGPGSQVILIGGAVAANIFWQVGTSATLGTTSGMKGNLLADQSITIQTGAALAGRALARIGAVTLDGNGVTVSRPLVQPPGPPGGGGAGASTNVFVCDISSPIVLNPQTGLFEQTVCLTNNIANTVDAVRLVIEGLPADVQVYNGHGKTNNVPFVQHNFPLAPGARVDLVIEYYRPSRQPIPLPAFVPQDTAAISATASGKVIAINNVRMPGGRFLIEFFTTAGRNYAVQYSADMTTWQTANPTIKAPGTRVQWYDDGPPKTESRPDQNGNRFYRVIVLP